MSDSTQQSTPNSLPTLLVTPETQPQRAPSVPLAHSNLSEWRARVFDVQSKNSSPEQLEMIKQRFERQRRVSHSVKQARRLEKACKLSSWSASSGLVQLQARNEAINGDRVEQQERLQFLSPVFAGSGYARSASHTIGDAAASPAATSEASIRRIHKSSYSNAAPAAQFSDAIREEEEADAELNAVEEELQEAGVDLTVDVEQELSRLLVVLRDEPKTDEETAHKFALYETFFATVQATREQVMAFWEASGEHFAGGAHTEGERMIKGIDNERAMGIEDSASFNGRPTWFVYQMAQQATANNRAMQRTLQTLRTRLELLSQECTCPICLEDFSGEALQHVETLGCCHRVCGECWHHWCEVCPQKICPLCKHEEFLVVVLSPLVAE